MTTPPRWSREALKGSTNVELLKGWTDRTAGNAKAIWNAVNEFCTGDMQRAAEIAELQSTLAAQRQAFSKHQDSLDEFSDSLLLKSPDQITDQDNAKKRLLRQQIRNILTKIDEIQDKLSQKQRQADIINDRISTDLKRWIVAPLVGSIAVTLDVVAEAVVDAFKAVWHLMSQAARATKEVWDNTIWPGLQQAFKTCATALANFAQACLDFLKLSGSALAVVGASVLLGVSSVIKCACAVVAGLIAGIGGVILGGLLHAEDEAKNVWKAEKAHYDNTLGKLDKLANDMLSNALDLFEEKKKEFLEPHLSTPEPSNSDHKVLPAHQV